MLKCVYLFMMVLWISCGRSLAKKVTLNLLRIDSPSPSENLKKLTGFRESFAVLDNIREHCQVCNFCTNQTEGLKAATSIFSGVATFVPILHRRTVL